MNNLLPLFRSEHSIGKSILTLNDIEKDKETGEEFLTPDDSPISIFGIAKKHNLSSLTLVERDCSGLIKCRNAADKLNLDLQFAVEVKVHDNECWHRLGVFLNETAFYGQFCKFLTLANTKLDFSMQDLRENWCEGFTLVIPFYDSFLYNNFLRLNHSLSPDFRGLNPIFFIEEHGLPFDEILKDKVVKFCEMHKYEMMNTHTICYYKDEDVEVLLTHRLITGRKAYGNNNLSKPNIDFMSSNEYSFESYLRRCNATI